MKYDNGNNDDSDDENIEYYKNLNSKENIQYLFNDFYYVFNFEFNRILYNTKPYDLNKLSNEKRLKLINECIDYFCNFYHEYIQELFINDIINNNQFIFLSENDKNEYLKIDNNDDKTHFIVQLFTKIRCKVIKYYIKDIHNYFRNNNI